MKDFMDGRYVCPASSTLTCTACIPPPCLFLLLLPLRPLFLLLLIGLCSSPRRGATITFISLPSLCQPLTDLTGPWARGVWTEQREDMVRVRSWISFFQRPPAHSNITIKKERKKKSRLSTLHTSLCRFVFLFLRFSCPPPLPDLSLLLLQLLSDDDAHAGAPRAPRPPPPTTHQTTYIPNSTQEVLHYVQHCSSQFGSLLTTFGVLGLHARQQHHGPSSLIDQHSTYTPPHTYPPHTHT